MKLGDLILLYLSSNKNNYHQLSTLLSGTYNYNENTFRVALSRLHKKGLAKKVNQDTWKITPEGRELFQKKNKGLRFFFSKKKPNKKPKKEILLLFDIPEKERYKRDWLRSELIGLGFEMIQKSVWLGPKLPKDLHAYLVHKKLIQYIRIFSIKK
jgi:DNA-binding transcriptional regulator PaaX